MAAFGTGASRQLQGRGGSAGFRFTLYALLSIVIMFLDERSHWLENSRYMLQAAAYPVQLAVSSPSAAWSWMQESFEARDALRSENNRLRAQQRQIEMRSMRFDALQKENAELRGLRDALPSVAERWEVAEVVNVQLSSLRQRILLNRGTSNGVFKGQAVLDEKGLLGQTLHVGPWSSEVILITDPEHAVPVEIERSGVRTIAVGAGDTASLSLPFLPSNADVKPGDLLVTSGLGGVFPAGYPVARVADVRHDASVRATPLANIDIDREALLVWFRADHPAAPGPASMTDTRAGNAKMQPLPAPPRPASAHQAGSETGAASSSPQAAPAASESKTKPGSAHAAPSASAASAAKAPSAPPAKTALTPSATGAATPPKAAAPSQTTTAPPRGTAGSPETQPAAGTSRRRASPEAPADGGDTQPAPASPPPATSSPTAPPEER